MTMILHTCRPKTGTITVSKVITGAPEDMTVFRCTLTGQSEYPTIVGPFDLSQEVPAICRNLPFDTYVITEEVQEGYTQTSVHDPIVLTRATRNQSVMVVNEIVVPSTPIKYGALYNWYAASKNGGTGVGSIAPAGYHVPSKIEFETLITELGGESFAGGKLKEIGTTYWNAPNFGADNSSGFNLRGAGQRVYNGVFASKNTLAYVSSITIHDIWLDSNCALNALHNAPQASMIAYGIGINYGFSLRCLKNTSDWTPGETVTDIDGNVYGTTKIGNQVWIAANLAVTKFNDGTPIPNVTDNAAWAALTTPGYCWYDNDINNK